MALKNTMTMTTDSGGGRSNTSNTSPYQRDRYADRVKNSRRANEAGSKLGISGAELSKTWGGDPSKLKTLETAAGALGGVTKTPYSYTDTSARDSYLASLQAQLNAQTAAYNQLLAYNQQMYDEQKKLAAQNREDAARRAYIAKEMALKNLPGQLAREGINGGLAETSYVRLNNRYNRSLAEGDSDYSDAVSRAYLDMMNANRGPLTGKMNAQSSYAAGLSNAPAAKTIRGVKVKDTGNPGAFYDSMSRLGYTDEQIANIWNSRR